MNPMQLYPKDNVNVLPPADEIKFLLTLRLVESLAKLEIKSIASKATRESRHIAKNYFHLVLLRRCYYSLAHTKACYRQSINQSLSQSTNQPNNWVCTVEIVIIHLVIDKYLLANKVCVFLYIGFRNIHNS